MSAREISVGTKINEFEEKVLEIRRVSKKTKGGNQIGFTALVVVGNRNGVVGTGYGKAKSVVDAISKAVSRAKENVVEVSINDNTISRDVSAKYGAAEVMLKPASKGTGIIAGGSVRTVVELAGIKDISSKMLGTSNKIGNVRCTIKALEKLRSK
ncbi:30S ribosomal protein S5 [Patescibacteria group bacterium]|nr:30S ribosomal protein S5 [Patescibacteria group bacterium]